MKIQSIGVVNQSAPNVSKNKNLKNQQVKKPSFGFNLQSAISTTWKSADEISDSLRRNYNMTTDFKGNDLVANMTEKTVNIFKELFPRSFLPKGVFFKHVTDENLKDCLGYYSPYFEHVVINANQKRFYNQSLLQIESIYEGSRLPLCKSFHSTKSELTYFVHEFVHRAHHANIEQNNNSWEETNKILMPDFYERVLNLKKIGEYATKNGEVVEVISEALTRQILDYPETIHYGNKASLFNYDDIPSSNAQKFLREVWDGKEKQAETTRQIVSDESYDKRSDDDYDSMMHSISAITGW